MNKAAFDVVGIGNALVDVLVHADDTFLEEQGLARGTMTLIDAKRAGVLYDLMPLAVEMSGGSAGNTMAGLASIGGRGAYIGRVGEDQLGAVFTHDIRASGVAFDVAASPGATGRCLIFVTADAQRTMQTFLGVGAELGPEDVDEALIASAEVTYLEGYLWDAPQAKGAFRKAAQAARAAGRRVALTLSDPFCVDRYREEFVDLVQEHIDILFANEHEVMHLYRSVTFDEALQRVRGACEIAALTRSEKGSVVATAHEVHVIDAEPALHVVDTTGAGDMYAAGFLFGLTRGRDLATCGAMGGIAAAEIISHFGARPETPLAQLVAHL